MAPIAIPLALIAGILKAVGFGKPADLKAEQVAGYIRDFIDGLGGAWDWDAFENMRLKNAVLDDIRRQAVAAGPPNANIPKLIALLAQTEALRISEAKQAAQQ